MCVCARARARIKYAHARAHLTRLYITWALILSHTPAGAGQGCWTAEQSLQPLPPLSPCSHPCSQPCLLPPPLHHPRGAHCVDSQPHQFPPTLRAWTKCTDAPTQHTHATRRVIISRGLGLPHTLQTERPHGNSLACSRSPGLHAGAAGGQRTGGARRRRWLLGHLARFEIGLRLCKPT